MSTFIQQEINKRTRWVYFSNYRWVAHLVYWLTVLYIGTFLTAKEPITAAMILNNFFLANINIAIFYYTYCLFLIPYFLKRNKYGLFWGLLVLSFFVLTLASYYFSLHIVHYSKGNGIDRKLGFWANYFHVASGYIYNFLFFAMLLFFMEKNEENSLVIEMEEEKKEIELVKLDLLKTNISPDFLIRSLKQLKKAAAEQAPYTPESIITFSELLRYRLYRGKQLQTPLKDEIAALNTFIDFIGFDHQNNNLSVKLEILGELPEGKSVAPLALINILEPFCKVIPQHPAALHLQLLIKADLLKLTIIYDQEAKDQLLLDLEQYGKDYSLLYASAIHFSFENCKDDDTCKIEMAIPILSQQCK